VALINTLFGGKKLYGKKVVANEIKSPTCNLGWKKKKKILKNNGCWIFTIIEFFFYDND